MSFSIVSGGDGVTRVVVDGSLDHVTMVLLGGELSILLKVRPTRVDLDLSSLRFVDNEGMGLLLSFVKRVYAQGGAFVSSNLARQGTAAQLIGIARGDGATRTLASHGRQLST